MKKLLFLLLLAMFFSGCGKKIISEIDYVGYGYYVWENKSEHTVEMSVPETPGYVGGLGFEFELAPGEKYEAIGTGMGSSPPPVFQKIDILFDAYYNDDSYSVEYRWKTIDEMITEYDYPYFPEYYDHRYDLFMLSNYIEETVKDPEGCRQCEGIRWTYTFTNADFVAALEYNEAQQEAAE